MSMPTATYVAQRGTLSVRLSSYTELAKPRIAALVLVTVAVAAFVGSGTRPDPWLLLHTILGTALIAASASALNQWIERYSDSLMQRTAERPLPAGRLGAAEVLVLGGAALLAGVLYLGFAVNWLTALIGLLTWFLYVVLYTPMKTMTPANTVVGAIAGALPVLIGWTAVNAPLALSAGGIKAATLFFIVYLWQFPHFMAIAWIYRHEYAAAGLQMLTVVDPTGRRAGVQAVVAAFALMPVSLLPALDRLPGLPYTAAAALLSSLFFYYSIRFFADRSERSARMLLRFSLVYLPALLALWILLPLV